jgi:hypothetical protein
MYAVAKVFLAFACLIGGLLAATDLEIENKNLDRTIHLSTQVCWLLMKISTGITHSSTLRS